MATEKTYPPFFAEMTAATEMFVADHRGRNVCHMPQAARMMLIHIEVRLNNELREYLIPSVKDESDESKDSREITST